MHLGAVLFPGTVNDKQRPRSKSSIESEEWRPTYSSSLRWSLFVDYLGSSIRSRRCPPWGWRKESGSKKRNQFKDSNIFYVLGSSLVRNESPLGCTRNPMGYSMPAQWSTSKYITILSGRELILSFQFSAVHLDWSPMNKQISWPRLQFVPSKIRKASSGH